MQGDDIVLYGPRTVLRRWRGSDLAPFADMNADAQVMRHFVAPLTRTESDALAARIEDFMRRRGYGWWVLQTADLAFAGCVGIFDVDFDLPGLPAPQVEIAWRLLPAAWGRGLASEAARRVLDHARHTLRLPRVVAFTTVANTPSLAVMQRIGMVAAGRFEHPRVPVGHPIRPHLLYRTAWG